MPIPPAPPQLGGLGVPGLALAKTPASTRAPTGCEMPRGQNKTGPYMSQPQTVHLEELAQLGVRLAGVLHDKVLQTLVATAYLAEDPDTSREDLVGHVRQATAELRLVIGRLQAPACAGDELATSLGTLARRLDVGEQLRVTVTPHGDLSEMGQVAGLALYRIAQEGAANVAHHGAVGQATITVSHDPVADTVLLEVADTGVGFDQAAAHPAGMGFPLMCFYARSAGGTVSIRSTPGRGTLVSATVPRVTPAS